MPRSREEILADIAENDRLQIANLEAQRQLRDDNKIEYFVPFEGTIDPNKTLRFPQQNFKQQEFFSSLRDEKNKVFIYTGGNRSGKTTAWAAIAPCICAGEWLWDNEKIHFSHGKPRKIRIVGQDWDKHIKAVVVPALKLWWPKNRPVTTRKNNNGVEAFWVDEKTGSSIEIMSNLQDSELFEGWEGDAVFYDEPPKRVNRVACARGLIDRHGIEVFGMTLLKEAWVDREVIKARDDDGKPDRSVFAVHTTIYDNAGFGIDNAGIAQFIKTLTEEEKEARIMGIPSYMSGLIYGKFSRQYRPKGHLVERFPIPTDWMVQIAIDVHPRERQAVLFMATSPKQERYLVNEIWEHGDGTWVGDEIARCVNQNAYRIDQEVIIDPLAKGDRNNDNTTYDKIETVLMRHGMLLKPASKDKNSGIINVKYHLVGPNKEPSLFVFDDLVRFILEIEGYMYIIKGEDMGKPQDKDDHMMENLYRLLLEDVTWVSPEEDVWEADSTTNRDARSGY